MKKFWKLDYFPAAMVLLGLVGLGIHQAWYVAAADARGLMVPGHPLSIALIVFSAAVAGLAALVVAPLKGTRAYAVNFPAHPRRVAGNMVLAGCILGTVMFQPCAMGGLMSQVWRWLGLGAALSLMWTALLRYTDKKPVFALYLPVCLFLAFHVVSHYRPWCEKPLIWDYLFPLLGSMALVSFSYYHMAFTVGFGQRRMLLFMGLYALYLCTVGIADSSYWPLSLGCMFWAWTELCAWHVPPEPEKPKEEPKDPKEEKQP